MPGLRIEIDFDPATGQIGINAPGDLPAVLGTLEIAKWSLMHKALTPSVIAKPGDGRHMVPLNGPGG